MFAPVPLIRRNYVRNKLRKAGAFSPQTAVTLKQAGVINPTWFPQVTKAMVKARILAQVGEKYYLAK